MKDVILSFAVGAMALTCRAGLVDCINPFIGTDAKGHCNPGATRPFAMVQPGPDTGQGDWPHCAGYQYLDKTMLGFSQNHLNGTGQGEMGDVLLLPFCGTNVLRKSAFSHANETSKPGYYAVTLDDARVRAELTCTDRVAYHRYTYLGSGPKRLIVDLQHGLTANPAWADKLTLFSETAFGEDGKSVFGSRAVRQYWPSHQVWFNIAFSHAIVAKRLLKSENPNEKGERWLLEFAVPDGAALEAKVTLSYRSVEGAKANLEECPGWDFEGVRRAARDAWEGVFGRIAVEGTTADERTALYTAIYHLCYQPNLISDVGARTRYSTFSLWDTYRAAHPLYTLLTPERVDDFIDSFLQHAESYGRLPIWEIYGLEGYDMLGAHSIPVVLDAWRKGFKVDLAKFYPYVKRTLTTDNRAGRMVRLHCRWDLLDRYGYFPCDLRPLYNLSTLNETSLDDWCAAEMAKTLGKGDDAAYFARRAGLWRNNIRPEVGWAWPRKSDGTWLEKYDPCWLIRPNDHPEGRTCDTDEGSSVQWSFHVLHDMPGLFAAMGGTERVREKLAFLFSHRPYWEGNKELDAQWPFVEVSGRIGEYSHGNEPCHHIPYLFTLLGDRAESDACVKRIADRFYPNRPDGVCGNDDCGQVSAWYVFAALGFYPVNPASAEYVVGGPLFDRLTLTLPNGRKLTVGRDAALKDVQFNGRPVAGGILRHADLVSGGALVYPTRKE